MAPTFYYRPLPMDDQWKEKHLWGCKLWMWLAVGAILVGVVGSLIIALSIYAVRVHSEACQHGLNATGILQRQLTQAKEALREAEIQADIYNKTVMTLRASLEVKTSLEEKQKKRVQELQEEITVLNQTLRSTTAELEKLRKNQATKRNSASSLAISTPRSLVPLLVLVLGAWLLL